MAVKEDLTKIENFLASDYFKFKNDFTKIVYSLV